MASNDVIQNRIEFDVLKSPNNFSQSALRLLVKKIKTACISKGILYFDGAAIDEFEQIILSRLDSGTEPLLKLLFRCIFGIINADIQFCEIFNEDPALFLEAVQQNDMAIYFDSYPSNTVTQTAQTDTVQLV
jgi:hypothetical protein